MDLPAHYHWQFAFRVLGIRRCQALWPYLGVPNQLVLAPATIMRASREFVLKLRAVAARGITAAIEPDIRAALETLSVHLLEDYERDVVSEVFEWGARYFVRDFPIWTRWSIVLGSLRHRLPPRLETDIESSSRAWLIGALEIRYGQSAREELHRVATEAEHMPLSSAEVDMVLIDAGSRGPEDPELFDVVEHAVSIVPLHHAYTFWRELTSRFTKDETEVFLDAAQRRAAEVATGPLRKPLVN